MKGEEKYVVFCTVPSEEVAEKIAKIVVEKRVGACVNIIKQIRSIYFWQGKVEDDSELLLIIKTSSQAFQELKETIRQNHPYKVPEIIAIPIIEGSESYLEWIEEVTQKKGGTTQEDGNKISK